MAIRTSRRVHKHTEQVFPSLPEIIQFRTSYINSGFPFTSRNNSISDESHQLFGIKPRLGQRTTVDNFSVSLNKSLNWPLFIQFDLMEDVTISEARVTTFASWRPSHIGFLHVLSNGIFIESQPLVPHDAHDKAKIRHRSFRLFRNPHVRELPTF